MQGTFVTMVRQAGEAGQLYGSVNARDIAHGLLEAGFTVTRNQVSLAEPIKSVGLHEVSIALHPEITVSVTANVARSEEEAEIQEQTGEAVIAAEQQNTLVDEEPGTESVVEDGGAKGAETQPSTEESDGKNTNDDTSAIDAHQDDSEDD